MKKTIIYIGLAVSVSLFAACSDLLDTNPKDFLSIESYYKTEDDVINSLGAIYSDWVARILMDGIWLLMVQWMICVIGTKVRLIS